MGQLKIGQVADQTGISNQTIRFYEKEGLIQEPERSPSSGYRLYEPKTVYRIEFILNARELGFSLGEIKDLLSIMNSQDINSDKYEKEVSTRKGEIEEKINKLQSIKTVLEDLVDKQEDEQYSSLKELASEGYLDNIVSSPGQDETSTERAIRD